MPLSRRRKGSRPARSKTPVVSAARLEERAAFARLFAARRAVGLNPAYNPKIKARRGSPVHRAWLASVREWDRAHPVGA